MTAWWRRLPEFVPPSPAPLERMSTMAERLRRDSLRLLAFVDEMRDEIDDEDEQDGTDRAD